MGNLGRGLKDALRKLAHRTSVDQLIESGVTQVNVVGMDRIAQLVEEAVYRSLKDKFLSGERAEVAESTREEFVNLMRSNESLEQSRNEAVEARERAEESVDELRRELEDHKRSLREKLASAEAIERPLQESENAAILARVEEFFDDVASDSPEALLQFKGRMAELVMSLIVKEREDAILARQVAKDAEAARLERRIEKITGILRETEGKLAYVASLKDVGSGISSVFREVQGLSAEDIFFEKKTALMSNLFEANMALQQGLED